MNVRWEQFVATHASTVLTAAVRILASPADADDVAQEVFLEIFRSGRIELMSTDIALLRTLATRRALDRLRRRKAVVELTGSETQTGDFEPYDYAVADELEQRLRHLLAELPPRESEVFCLIYFEQQSPADVSRTLGISAGAVAKALCKARQRLAEAFDSSETKAQQ